MGRGPAVQMEEMKHIFAIRASDPMMPDTTLAKLVGRSNKTVARVQERYKALISQYRELKSRDIIDDLDSIRRANLMHVADPKVISKMSGLQAATTYAILTDKMLLESGRPTSIHLTATVDATMPDVLSRLKRALEARRPTSSSVGQGNQPATMLLGQQADRQVYDSSDDAVHESDKE